MDAPILPHHPQRQGLLAVIAPRSLGRKQANGSGRHAQLGLARRTTRRRGNVERETSHGRLSMPCRLQVLDVTRSFVPNKNLPIVLGADDQPPSAALFVFQLLKGIAPPVADHYQSPIAVSGPCCPAEPPPNESRQMNRGIPSRYLRAKKLARLLCRARRLLRTKSMTAHTNSFQKPYVKLGIN